MYRRKCGTHNGVFEYVGQYIPPYLSIFLEYVLYVSIELNRGIRNEVTASATSVCTQYDKWDEDNKTRNASFDLCEALHIQFFLSKCRG